MTSNEEVRKWYNTFSAKQQKTGINLRHYSIFNQLIDSGMKKQHNVLEIGCGIGTLTQLIHSYLKKGHLVATDISNGSIETAQKRIGRSDRLELVVSDMSDFKSSKKFDFIVLPDVLEHIPVDQHLNLFRVIAEHMHAKSRIFIHVPHPKALAFIRENFPEQLQIIDQSIGADEVMNTTYPNNLELIHYKAYPLFHKENDYVSILLKLNENIQLTQLTKYIIIRRKFIQRMRFIWNQLF
jgi:trans-aconitate 2-methyltransferase